MQHLLVHLIMVDDIRGPTSVQICRCVRARVRLCVHCASSQSVTLEIRSRVAIESPPPRVTPDNLEISDDTEARGVVN